MERILHTGDVMQGTCSLNRLNPALKIKKREKTVNTSVPSKRRSFCVVFAPSGPVCPSSLAWPGLFPCCRREATHSPGPDAHALATQKGLGLPAPPLRPRPTFGRARACADPRCPRRERGGRGARSHVCRVSSSFFGKEGDVHSSHVRPSISFGTGLAPSP